MKKIILFAGCLLLGLPVLSSAADLGVNGTTIIRIEERSVPGFDKERVVPATQFLGIDADKLGSDNLSLHLYGWGRADLSDRSNGEGSTDADLSYGYLDYRFPKANGDVRAGRFFLYEGVAAEQVDGVSARADLARGFTLSVYGGAPTKLDRGSNTKGDYILGGRIGYRLAGIMELGVSGLQEGQVTVNTVTGAKDDRQLIGTDLWLSPHRLVELSGRTVYDIATQGMAEQTYLLTYRIVPAFSVNGEYNEHNFKDYFAFTNLRTLFNPDTGDKVKYFGGAATWTIAKPVELTADYRHYTRDSFGDSDRFGADLRLNLIGNKLRSGASYHRLSGATGVNSYHEMRGYLLYDSGKYTTSIDAITHLFDDSIYGKSSAFELLGSLGYRLLPNLALSGDLSYGQNPQTNGELKGLVRLTFNYSMVNKGAGK